MAEMTEHSSCLLPLHPDELVKPVGYTYSGGNYSYPPPGYRFFGEIVKKLNIPLAHKDYDPSGDSYEITAYYIPRDNPRKPILLEKPYRVFCAYDRLSFRNEDRLRKTDGKTECVCVVHLGNQPFRMILADELERRKKLQKKPLISTGEKDRKDRETVARKQKKLINARKEASKLKISTKKDLSEEQKIQLSGENESCRDFQKKSDKYVDLADTFVENAIVASDLRDMSEMLHSAQKLGCSRNKRMNAVFQKAIKKLKEFMDDLIWVVRKKRNEATLPELRNYMNSLVYMNDEYDKFAGSKYQKACRTISLLIELMTHKKAVTTTSSSLSDGYQVQDNSITNADRGTGYKDKLIASES